MLINFCSLHGQYKGNIDAKCPKDHSEQVLDMITLADLIRAKRKELGESQEVFGKRFGISHVAVSDWERGVTRFFPEELIKLLFDFNERPSESEYLSRGYNEALKDMQIFLIEKKRF